MMKFHFKLKDKEEDMSEIDMITDEDAERLRCMKTKLKLVQ
jgi:hypothetical protein